MQGFIVGRKPQFNKTEPNDLNPYAFPLPTFEGVIYSGIDRLCYYDFEQDYIYNSDAPELVEDLAQLIELYKKYDSENLLITTIRDIETANSILEVSNREEERNKLIVVSPHKKLSSNFTLPDNCHIEWLGIDIYVYGEWSLISDGYFRAPKEFAQFKESINKHGLLKTSNEVPDICNLYMDLAKRDIVEETAENPNFELVWVGRLIFDE